MDSNHGLAQFLAYHRVMSGVCLGAAVAGTALLAVLKRDEPAWAGGFAIGSAAQLAKFAFIDVNVVRKIAVEKKDAASTQLKAMFLSLAVFAAAIVVSHKLGMNVWAMAAGIFLPRIILVADTMIRPDPFKNGANTNADNDNEPVEGGNR